MATKLVTLKPDMDVFETIGLLLEHRVSGAPVIDKKRRFLGVFSEKTSMKVLLDAFCERLPTARVLAFMDTDQGRLIGEETDLLSLAQTFIDTPYRRLPVVRQRTLLGQVSRHDVLRAGHLVSKCMPIPEQALREPTSSGGVETECGGKQVSSFMDTAAQTIDDETDMLRIAQIFGGTPYRRLPVLKEGRLIGQVSRRDLLRAAYDNMSIAPVRTKRPLYLSSVVEAQDVPL